MQAHDREFPHDQPMPVKNQFYPPRRGLSMRSGPSNHEQDLQPPHQALRQSPLLDSNFDDDLEAYF